MKSRSCLTFLDLPPETKNQIYEHVLVNQIYNVSCSLSIRKRAPKRQQIRIDGLFYGTSYWVLGRTMALQQVCKKIKEDTKGYTPFRDACVVVFKSVTSLNSFVATALSHVVEQTQHPRLGNNLQVSIDRFKVAVSDASWMTFKSVKTITLTEGEEDGEVHNDHCADLGISTMIETTIRSR